MRNGATNGGRGRKKLKTVPNITQRSTSKAPATNLHESTSKAPATNFTASTSKAQAAAKTLQTNHSPTFSRTSAGVIPEQYTTPARQSSQPQLHETPQTPLQNTTFPSSGALHVRNFPPPEHLFQPSTSQPQRQVNPTNQSANPLRNSSQEENVAQSPLHHSQAQSHPSSQGHNYEDLEDVAAHNHPGLQEDTLRAVNALLGVPDRHKFVPLLSPDSNTPDSTW